MNNLLNIERLEMALTLLAGRLKLDRAPPINLVVCGGSSLIALGLVLRTTRDVDVVALLDENHELQSAEHLPEFLISAAEKVARDMGLEDNWLNPGPGSQFRSGFPGGFLERLHPRTYGPELTVNFIDRIDQIHFKVYAAVDQGPGRHLDDLIALKPSSEEIEQASRWAMTNDPSDGFRTILIGLLGKLGYERISERI